MPVNDKTLDTVFGRWRSQILYAGVKLGIFDCIASIPKNASNIAKELGLDSELTYRLLRALGSMGFLREERNREFSITDQGKLFSKDHPQTLRGVILLEEGPEHYAIWKQLPDIITDGKQDAFLREYGQKIFEYADKNPAYGEIFNQAMNSYSRNQTTWVLEALDGYNFSNIHSVCDVGGGHGHLLSSLLVKYPHVKGSILELQSVAKDNESLWPTKMGVHERCAYLVGDMFNEVPPADAYIMKMILHDWNDEECVKILGNIFRSSTRGGKVFIAEHLIPGPEKSHFSKLFDIHMMCVASGRERTAEEYAALLERAGWKHVNTFQSKFGLIGVIEGIKQSA